MVEDKLKFCVKKETRRVNPFLQIDTIGVLTQYRMHFNSPVEIISYIQKYNKVNTQIFSPQLSLTSPEYFAGDSLENALGYLVSGYSKDFEQFLKLKKDIDRVNKKAGVGTYVETSVVGSRPNVPAYIAGAPKNMYRMMTVDAKKFITIYMDLSYPGNTSRQQILNRGILVLNLITLLESSGYRVNFRVVQSSYVGTEAFRAEIVLKKTEENINIKKCYYPMCSVEFLRRVMARVLESLPVKENWGMSYGMMMDDQRREYFQEKKDPKAIYIYSPQEMGIKGNDIGEDADAFLEKINLSKEIHFPRYKKENSDGKE